MSAANSTYDGGRGVNPISQNYNLDNTTLISTFLLTPLENIEKHIPKKTGIRISHCFHLLVIIKDHSRLTASQYVSMFNSSMHVMEKNLGYLVELGMIKTIGRPRLIVPFQKFKVDKAYVITDKGKNVIKRIMLGE